MAVAVKTLQEYFQKLQHLRQRVVAADRLQPGSGRKLLPLGFRLPISWDCQTL